MREVMCECEECIKKGGDKGLLDHLECSNCSGSFGLFWPQLVVNNNRIAMKYCGNCGHKFIKPSASLTLDMLRRDVGLLDGHYCEEGDTGYCVHCHRWMVCNEETGDPISEPNANLTGNQKSDCSDAPTVREVIDWMLSQVAISNGCTTGDCPHAKGTECLDALESSFNDDRQNANPHGTAAPAGTVERRCSTGDDK